MNNQPEVPATPYCKGPGRGVATCASEHKQDPGGLRVHPACCDGETWGVRTWADTQGERECVEVQLAWGETPACHRSGRERSVETGERKTCQRCTHPRETLQGAKLFGGSDISPEEVKVVRDTPLPAAWLQVEKPMLLQQHLDFRGGTCMTRGREERRKEAGKNVKD